jgi:hypothetical protein
MPITLYSIGISPLTHALYLTKDKPRLGLKNNVAIRNHHQNLTRRAGTKVPGMREHPETRCRLLSSIKWS